MNKFIIFVLLLIIILFHVINNYIWLRNDTSYLMHDSHHHFLFSLNVFNEMKQSIIPLPSRVFERGMMHNRWHGILVGYVTAPFYFITGMSQDMGVMINTTLFFIILILSTYGIGKIIFNQQAGLLSAFIIGMYPQIFNHLRIYMLDLPLTALVCLSIYFLLRSEKFTRKYYSFLFCFTFVLGFLIKFNYLIFIIGPLGVILFKKVTDQNFNMKIKKDIAYKICIGISILLILSFPFMKLKLISILNRIYDSTWIKQLCTAVFIQKNNSIGPFMLEWLVAIGKYWLWLVHEMYNTIISFFFLFIFVVSLILFLKRKIKYKSLIFMWIFLPLIIMSLFIYFSYPFHSLDRYVMPILPPIAIISAVTIMSINYKIIKKFIIFFVLTFGIFQYSAISYNLSLLPEEIALYLPDRIFGVNNYFSRISLFSRDIPVRYRNDNDKYSHPFKNKLQIEQMLRKILSGEEGSKRSLSVFFLDNIPEIYEPIEYLSYINNYPINIIINSLSEEFFYLEVSKISKESIAWVDYAVIAEEPVILGLSVRSQKRVMQSRHIFGQTKSNFHLINKFRLGSKNNILLYKNSKIHPAKET